MLKGFILTMTVIFLFGGIIGMVTFLVYIAVKMIIVAVKRIRKKHTQKKSGGMEINEKNFDKEVELCQAIQAHYDNMQKLIAEREKLDFQINEADYNIRYMTECLKDMLLGRAVENPREPVIECAEAAGATTPGEELEFLD